MNELISNFGIDWKIFSAEVVNFLVIIFVLYYFVFRKISITLSERQKTIIDGIEKSKSAETKLEEAGKKAEEIIRDSRVNASEKINQAIDSASDKKKEILDEAKKEKQNILDDASKKAEAKKEDIIKGADAEIAKLAILAAEKILKEK